jgi:hypothetical protein
MLTSRLALWLIAVDWRGYPAQDFHVLRASLICDGSSLTSDMQQNAGVQAALFNALSEAIGPAKKVIIITDAGFRNTCLAGQDVASLTSLPQQCIFLTHYRADGPKL